MNMVKEAAPALSSVTGKALELGKKIMPPEQFVRGAVGGIAGFLGAIAPPLLTVALMGMGLKIVVTGKKPPILGQ